MYKIIDERSSGKTSRLMLLAKENNGIIVCRSPQLMQEKAYRYGITGIDFISYEKYLYTDDYDLSKPIYIDEIEQFLQIIDDTIEGYTLSLE